MPRKLRLSSGDLDRFKKQLKVRGHLFAAELGIIEGRLSPGGVCIISKKVSKSAVERNRIRRHVRAALVSMLSDLMQPYIILYITQKKAAYTTGENIRAEVVSLARRLLDEAGR
jgi:ribonuclease P protein component